MSEDLHDIDEFFKKPIESHSEMPPASVWQAIENNFDKSNHVELKKKYQYLKRVAAVLFLLLCGSIFFLVSKNNNKKILVKEKNNATKIETKNTLPTANENIVNNIATQKSSIAQDISPTYIPKNNDNTIPTATDTALQKEKPNTLLQNKNTFATNGNVQYVTKLSTNTISKNNEANSNNDEEENFSQKNKSQSSKNKTSIFIKNARAEEEPVLVNIDNTTNNKNKYVLLQSSIVLQEKTIIAQINFKPKINLLLLSTVTNKNLVAAAASNNKKQHTFSATIYASPEFAFNRLEDDKSHQDRNPPPPPNANRPRDDRDKIKREENKTTSFSAGILVDYSLSKKITMQSGIGFTSKSTEAMPKKVFAEQNANGEVKYKNNCSLGATYINPKTGVVTNVGDSAILGNTKNTVQYLSFPLNMLYHFKVGKFQISPMVGVAANILVKQKATTSIEGAEKQNLYMIEGVNKNYFNANIGVGIDYTIGKNISLTAMPNARIGLNPLNKNSNVKFYSNTVGLMVGVKYYF
jgi:hypothetical protein